MDTMSDAPDEPTEAERTIFNAFYAPNHQRVRLSAIRAHVAAEVAKATAELQRDKERLDWLERNLMHLSHDRSSASMDGVSVQGQLYNEARGSNGGPSYFRVHHRSIREALDAARAQANPPT